MMMMTMVLMMVVVVMMIICTSCISIMRDIVDVIVGMAINHVI